MSHDIERLRAVLNANVATMEEAADAFPWESKLAYADLIAQTYYYSRHTTRILGLAGVHFDFDFMALHDRFLRHAAEEAGHEKLAINDLKTLGYSIDVFKELPATMALYQTQYYWIQHVHPASTFGYILSLEGFAERKCRWMYETCRKLYGERASQFWKVHAEDDPDHIEKAWECVTKLPVETLRSVEVNLVQTATYYRAIYTDITERTRPS